MKANRILFVTAMMAGLGLACSSSGDDDLTEQPPIDEPAPTTAAQFVDQARSAVCQHLIACGQMPDEELCAASGMAVDPHWWPGVVIGYRQHTVWDYVVEDVAAGIVRYNADAAPACLAALRARVCAWYDYFPTLPPACDPVLSGTVAQDDACMPYRSQCEGDLTLCAAALDCDEGEGCCESFCTSHQAAPPISPVGEPCQGDTYCVEGAYCDAGTCEQGEPDGTPCGVPNDGVTCAGSCDRDMGVCYTTGREGESCDPAARWPCLIGAETWCNPDTLVCEAQLAAGAACASSAPCVGAFSCVDGTCQWEDPAPRLDEACEWIPVGDGGMEAQCLGRLSCDDADRCTLEALPGSCG